MLLYMCAQEYVCIGHSIVEVFREMYIYFGGDENSLEVAVASAIARPNEIINRRETLEGKRQGFENFPAERQR